MYFAHWKIVSWVQQNCYELLPLALALKTPEQPTFELIDCFRKHGTLNKPLACLFHKGLWRARGLIPFRNQQRIYVVYVCGTLSLYIYVSPFLFQFLVGFGELNIVTTHQCLTRFSAVPVIKPVINNVGVG